jgi:hypothetical protein
MALFKSLWLQIFSRVVNIQPSDSIGESTEA